MNNAIDLAFLTAKSLALKETLSKLPKLAY